MEELFDKILPRAKVTVRVFKTVHNPSLMAYDLKSNILLIAGDDYLFKFYKGADGELAMVSKDKISKCWNFEYFMLICGRKPTFGP
jgi:hypothetical protein